MTTLSLIKSQVMYLFKTNPKVHIDISNRSDRKHLTNVAAVITAVYPNIFTAKLKEDGIERNYTFQYVDLLTHTMEIKELIKVIFAKDIKAREMTQHTSNKQKVTV